MSGDVSYRELKTVPKESNGGQRDANSDTPNGDSEALMGTNKSVYDLSMEQELPEDLTGQNYEVIKALGEPGQPPPEFWGTEVDLDENAYGAAAVAIVKDIAKLHYEIKIKAPWSALSLNITRLTSALGIMAINLVFQGLILWYINIYVVQPSVRHVQMLYAHYHAENFDEDGVFNEAAWENYEHKDGVCQITMSSRYFYFGILMLWGLLMMQELRACERVVRDILAVRSVKHFDQMVEYKQTGNSELGGRCLIVGLTPGMRWSVLLIVCLPRIIIAIFLFGLGCRWLSSSASFADMTLNAMALEFVKNIDELLYDSILPRQLKKDIADTNVFKIEERKKKVDMDREEWSGYMRTTFWVVVITTFIGTYGAFFQSVLPFDLSELAEKCQEQTRLTQTSVCDWPTLQGWSQECYPYGHLLAGLTGMSSVHSHGAHHPVAHGGK
mmetsp:Transcript_118889/g.296588  ORF Transcript_118889/g.296588 Transcript_118889/m.296588 type:complete len:442 (-) Transcript_118889:244-1569(-)